jgi:hypothetical protein
MIVVGCSEADGIEGGAAVRISLLMFGVVGRFAMATSPKRLLSTALYFQPCQDGTTQTKFQDFTYSSNALIHEYQF